MPTSVLDAAADAAPAGVNPRTLLLFGAPAEAIRAASDGIVDLLVTGFARATARCTAPCSAASRRCLSEGAPHPVLVLPRMSGTC